MVTTQHLKNENKLQPIPNPYPLFKGKGINFVSFLRIIEKQNMMRII